MLLILDQKLSLLELVRRYEKAKRSLNLTKYLRFFHDFLQVENHQFSMSKNEFYLYEDLSSYERKRVDPEKSFEHLEFGGLHCNFTYEVDINEMSEMEFVIYDGWRTFANGKFRAKIQVCGLVPKCLKCDLTNFAAPMFRTLQISGHFKPKSTIMPVGLDPDLLPITNFTYTKTEDLTSMQIFQKSVYSAALYARIYD